MLRAILITIISVFCVAAAYAQSVTVDGVVRDDQGMPIPGAAVMLKGTTQGAVTDADGRYSLRISETDRQNGVLVFTFIGMTDLEKPIAGQPTVDADMQPEYTEVDEVMVVAFGEQKRSSFTGSAAVIGAEKLADRQVTNVTNALQGRVAGLQVLNSSGAPESTPTMRIRGTSSISSGNSPLIIVDGMPYEGGLNNINPADVESMTVLKDAASNALYGARGANGVIMITTKKGKAGEGTIKLDAKWGVNTRGSVLYDVIDNPAEYYETHYRAVYNYLTRENGVSAAKAHKTINESWTNAPSGYGLGYVVYAVPEGEYLVGDNGRLNPGATLGNRVYKNSKFYTLMPDKWVDEAFRKGSRQEYNFSATGGNERGQFYGSLGYLKSDGIVKHSDYKRVTARVKASYQIKEWFNLGGNANFSHYDYNSVDDSESTNIFSQVTTMGPIYPVYVRDGDGRIMHDENGRMYDYGDGSCTGIIRPVVSKLNPLKDDELNTYNTQGNSVTVNGAFNFTPIENLKVTLNAGVGDREYRITTTYQPFYGYGAASYPNGMVGKGHNRMYTLNFQQLANNSVSFDQRHNLNILAGHESYRQNSQSLSAVKTGVYSYFGNQELGGAVTASKAADYTSYDYNYNTEGWLARLQYDFEERYFVSGSFRRDASSRFHPDHRWGNFYSVGLAWIATKEEFLRPLTGVVNNLKLKASIGQQGNDKLGGDSYSIYYTDTYSIGNFAGDVSLVFRAKGNENITWETNTNMNIGLEFGVLKDRVSGSVELFKRKTTDMLVFFNTPWSLGYSGYYDNIGDMVNGGVELDLTGEIIRLKDFTWSVNLNLTHYKNEITYLAANNKNLVKNGHGGYQSGYYFIGEGLPYHTFYMKKYAGVDPESGKALYAKQNGTTTTSWSDADFMFCGDPTPDIYGGFGTNLAWNGIDVGVSFGYSVGGKTYDAGYAALMQNPTSSLTGGAMHRDMLSAWSEDNTGGGVPRLQFNDRESGYDSSRWLTDASWITLQSVSAGYNLPKDLLEKMHLKKFRVSFSAENLWWASKRKGMDPRTSFSGMTSTASYSPTKSISGGITIEL